MKYVLRLNKIIFLSTALLHNRLFYVNLNLSSLTATRIFNINMAKTKIMQQTSNMRSLGISSHFDFLYNSLPFLVIEVSRDILQIQQRN